jgi:hypothetical protein
MVVFLVSATLMLMSASEEVEASGDDATSGGGVPIAVAGLLTVG